MSFQNPWLKYGVLFGLTSIAFSITFFYLLDMGLFKQSLFIYGALILFMVLAGLEYRKTHQNIMLYGEAFKVTFLTALIGMMISMIFSMLLLELIDPDLKDTLIEKALASTQGMMESFGAPEDEINQAMEKLEEEMPNQFTLVGQLKNLISVTVISAILAAIISIFLRKEEKVA